MLIDRFFHRCLVRIKTPFYSIRVTICFNKVRLQQAIIPSVAMFHSHQSYSTIKPHASDSIRLQAAWSSGVVQISTKACNFPLDMLQRSRAGEKLVTTFLDFKISFSRVFSDGLIRFSVAPYTHATRDCEILVKLSTFIFSQLQNDPDHNCAVNVSLRIGL